MRATSPLPRQRVVMGFASALVATAAVVLSPVPSGAVTSGGLSLFAAACPTVTFCVAVGQLNPSSNATAYAQTWNGKTWTVRTVPVPKGSTGSAFSAVSCTGSKFCMAVGDFTSSSPQKSLVEKWNGKAWTIVPSPNPTGGSYVVLNSVSCTTTTACTAVGKFDTTTGHETWIALWSNGKWTTTLELLPKNDQYPALDGVSCVSKPFCMTVGGYVGPSPEYYDYTDAYAWSGKSWKPANPVTPTTTTSLSAVACTSATGCVTVGTTGESWNGHGWTAATLPAPKGSQRVFLQSVSCVSTKLCMAVGHSSVSVNATQYLTETWNGKAWKVRAVPEPSGGMTDQLIGVSCVSAKACTAVGFYATSVSSLATLQVTVEAWNGTTWSQKA